MSLAACGKEVLCLTAESTYASSNYSEFMTQEELRDCSQDAEKYAAFRIELANRADKAAP